MKLPITNNQLPIANYQLQIARNLSHKELILDSTTSPPIIITITSIFRNLSYKAILGHHWISSYCPEADLVVKSDDDFFVDLPMLRSIHASLMPPQCKAILYIYIYVWPNLVLGKTSYMYFQPSAFLRLPNLFFS